LLTEENGGPFRRREGQEKSASCPEEEKKEKGKGGEKGLLFDRDGEKKCGLTATICEERERICL